MAGTTTKRLRNVVLLSHSGAGKTILSESMLYAAGVTSRVGAIEEGNTVSDYEPEEARRQSSVQASILSCPWRDHKINLIDTPGYADFRGEVAAAVRVADAAVIVVDGPSGLEVGTRQMWNLAANRDLPRVVFVSKMDRENADFGRIVGSLTETFGRHCVPVHVCIGSESDFSGVVSLLDPDADVPEALQQEIEDARERLVEAVAETDDDLTMKYLEGEPLSHEELTEGLRKGIAAGSIVPVFAGASAAGIGVKEMLDAIVDFLPSPADLPAPSGANGDSEERPLTADSDGPLAALVFKTTADPFVGRLSYFRVYSGTVRSGNQVWNSGAQRAERIAQPLDIRGESQEPKPEVVAGDIAAVAKLSSVLTGHTLTTKESPVTLPGIEFPPDTYQRAVYPKTKADVDKMTSSLSRIAEEDPSLTVTREPDTLEMLLGGLGDTHLEVTIEKIKRKFGVDILLQLPRVAYKETIGLATKVEYRHKKQSGGHGQFGHVWLELEPLPRGTGFEFGDKVVGGVVPKEYIPSVQKGVTKALSDGAVAGFSVVDLRATLVDGSYHSVDSSGVSFEIAGNHALTKGIQQANPVLLEPMMKVRITVPDSFTGDIMGDLNSKRGRIQGMSPLGDGMTSIEAEVPQSEMLDYATQLRSQTQGLGYFEMKFDHYEEVPQHEVPRIVQVVREQEEARA